MFSAFEVMIKKLFAKKKKDLSFSIAQLIDEVF